MGTLRFSFFKCAFELLALGLMMFSNATERDGGEMIGV